MQVEYNKKDKQLIFILTEEIDHCTSERIRKKADFEIQVHLPKKVIFDFENVGFMDSSGIGMLVGRFKLVSMLGGKTSIKNVKPSIKKVLEMSGILKLIPIEKKGGIEVEECI